MLSVQFPVPTPPPPHPQVLYLDSDVQRDKKPDTSIYTRNQTGSIFILLLQMQENHTMHYGLHPCLEFR